MYILTVCMYRNKNSVPLEGSAEMLTSFVVSPIATDNAFSNGSHQKSQSRPRLFLVSGYLESTCSPKFLLVNFDFLFRKYLPLYSLPSSNYNTPSACFLYFFPAIEREKN